MSIDLLTFPIAPLVLLTCGMALHTVLKIANSLLQVLSPDLSFIVLMTAITRIGRKAGGVTGGTGRSAAVAQREAMLPVEFSRTPCSGGMADRTICAKLVKMELWFLMTRKAIGA